MALLDAVWDYQVSWHQTGKTNLDLLEQEKVSGSGISWARHITMPASHHSVFFQAGCHSCRPTISVKALKAHYIHFTVYYTLYCTLFYLPSLAGMNKYQIRHLAESSKQRYIRQNKSNVQHHFRLAIKMQRCCNYTSMCMSKCWHAILQAKKTVIYSTSNISFRVQHLYKYKIYFSEDLLQL